MKHLLWSTLALVLACAFVAGTPAYALNCPTYSYTLTNGQTADATQVMANFNSILSCTNTNLAHNGANSDITSLSGLLTPLSVSQGGTGSANIFGANNTWSGTNTFSSGIVGTSTGWTTARTLTLNGSGVSGSVNWDGTANATLTTTPALQYATFQNQQAQGVGASGSGTTPEAGSATYATMNINTSVNDTITGASLSANQMTLPAGAYRVEAFVPAYSVTAVQSAARCRLYNVTDSATLLQSDTVAPGTSGTSNYATTIALTGSFALSGTKSVALQCQTTDSTHVFFGSGPGVYGSGTEYYETVSLLKIG